MLRLLLTTLSFRVSLLFHWGSDRLRYLFLFIFKANFNRGLFSDHSIVEEEDEGEEYDDVDEDLKAQILGRNEAEQEEQTAAEEGIDWSTFWW